MASYKIADRAKEWTTYIGAGIGALAVALPQVVPPDQWVHWMSYAQLVLGTVMMVLPQTAGSQAIENDALPLLQALASKIPAEYNSAMQPFLAMLAKAAIQPPFPPNAPPAVVPGVLVPQAPPIAPVDTAAAVVSAPAA